MLARRAVGFAALPGLSMLSALVLLPMVTRYQGPEGWTALALGQSIGSVVSVIAGLAWPFIGGNSVASQSAQERRTTFMLSLWSRMAVLVPGVMIAVGVIFALRTAMPLVTALFMVGIAGNALSSAWFYAGTGQPRHLILAEGIPRSVGYAVSIVLLAWTHDILLYAMMTVIAQAVSLFINAKFALGILKGIPRITAREILSELRKQFSGTVSRTAVALGQFGGPMVVAAINPAVLGIFSAMDTVYKTGTNATSFLPSAFVSWVSSRKLGEGREKRIGRSLVIILAVCVAGVLVWAAAGGPIIRLLYAGQVPDSRWMVILIGISVFAALFVNAVEILAMVPLGRDRTLFRVQLIAALLGLVFLMCASTIGAVIAFSSYLGIQLGRLILYGFALRKAVAPIRRQAQVMTRRSR